MVPKRSLNLSDEAFVAQILYTYEEFVVKRKVRQMVKVECATPDECQRMRGKLVAQLGEDLVKKHFFFSSNPHVPPKGL